MAHQAKASDNGKLGELIFRLTLIKLPKRMKHLFITYSMLMLCALNCWAQETKTSAKDSICVFDGTLTNVPDGTEIWVGVPNTEDRIGACSCFPVTTVKDGKFHFERALEQGKSPYLEVGIWPIGFVRVELYPGMKTTITGDGMYPRLWIAVNDHPDQKEANIYAKFKREKLADFMAIYAKKDMASSGVYTDTTEVGKRSAMETARYYASQLAPLWDGYFNTMYEFMKDRPFCFSFEYETGMLSQYAHDKKDEEKLEKCRKLFAKFPDDNSMYASSIKRDLQPQYKSLEAGDQARDFTLYDHDGKPHGILETLGKGKYLLLEMAYKCCEGEKLERPKGVLKELFSKYSDKLDIVTLTSCAKEKFDSKDFPREEWLELGFNNDRASFDAIDGTYFAWGERFIFISPEGKILAKYDSDKLQEGMKKNFPFIVE